MQALNHDTYMELRDGASVLEADGSGEKVLHLRDGRMLKLFRRKRLFTSAALYPYARRFADNTRALRERNIPCPDILAVYRIASIQRDAVYYEPLAGRTVRQLMDQPDQAQLLRARLGTLVAQLHATGVYFRSLHLGNIVQTPEQTLGLIDIADLKCQRGSLSSSKRLRNFRHMLRYEKDRQWLQGEDSGRTFLNSYQQALKPLTDHKLMRKIEELLS
ncbi:lipopolysaccharide kinase InaA family protein [Pseudomonas corrugata]|uniref:lipopolysaccharide kinase InaA family protein n=1 Tax=Pseudomonas corrugata TaxID=47879 RepID=UPI0006D89F75|nr:lipopolysaccharide kinase InaA family protein [Pseudomonas corrugata]MDU9035863.1 lipopolysaccharide kinase InaA family protein [Pseudomonas corrugata]UZD95935.1 lipopolysaccharide kinase InaA family protein [Pseudomonas corrugata]